MPVLRAPVRSPASELKRSRSLRSRRDAVQTRAAAPVAVASKKATAPKALKLEDGSALPLGPSPVGKTGVNFALWSKNATKVTLVLFRTEGSDEPTDEFEVTAKTGDVWHAAVSGCPQAGVRYAFRVAGPDDAAAGHRFDDSVLLLDPYAPLVEGRRTWGDMSAPPGVNRWTGSFDFASPPFDWQGVTSPAHPPEKLVVYEVGVRHFTGDASSGLEPQLRGTFLGMAAKVDYLKALGVTAVELLPVFEYDELEFQRDVPSVKPRAHMTNTWGYSTLGFFAPMCRFGVQGEGAAAAARDFKTLVRTLHSAGIEVLLDVVYNHTAEGGDVDPYLISMRGIDNKEYYIVDPEAPTMMLNYSGCGNSLSGNGDVGKALILDSLRHWVTEYHVDGFRFDLASELCRRPVDGAPLDAPPVIQAIAEDAVLASATLIAEPWDCGGLYQVGSFPAWGRWAEWNGVWRDTVRRFVRGDGGQKPGFATRMAGSEDMYAPSGRKPWHSLNFVTAHDGFSMADLVAYNGKHNDANGEGNRDGTEGNESWNCGAEGPTDDAAVNALRARQHRNMLLALLLSAGMPMLLCGDEYGHTKGGNNNTYGLDGPVNNFAWGQVEGDAPGGAALLRFTSAALRFRQDHASTLCRAEFLTHADVTWHESDWENPESRFLAWSLHPAGGGGAAPGTLYIAFNSHGFPIDELPLPAPPAACEWHRVADTWLPSPKDFDEAAAKPVGPTYTIAPHSALLLMAVAKA